VPAVCLSTASSVLLEPGATYEINLIARIFLQLLLAQFQALIGVFWVALNEILPDLVFVAHFHEDGFWQLAKSEVSDEV